MKFIGFLKQLNRHIVNSLKNTNDGHFEITTNYSSLATTLLELTNFCIVVSTKRNKSLIYFA